jgi:hypothetical protein
MNENILFLLLGSAIGLITSLVTSLVTILVQYKLEIKRQKRQWEFENEKEMIRDARRFLENNKLQLKLGTPSSSENFVLHVISGNDQGKTFLISDPVSFLGSSRKLCKFVLSESNLDSIHLKITIFCDAVFIENMSEKSTVRVNGNEILNSEKITIGSEIQVGDSLLKLIRSK